MSFVTIPLAIGWPQVVLIAVVILILFGGRKIPELMRGLGSGGIFKRGKRTVNYIV